MTRIYSGTATVENGSTTVIIAAGDPLTSANCPSDAPISLDGVGYHVASRTDTTTIELLRAYEGADGTVAVEIDPLTPDALSVVNIAVLVARVQAQLNVLDKNSQGLFYNRVGVTGDTDTAPGNLAFNNADPTMVTAFYIDNLDGNQRSVTGLLDLWTSGTIVLIRSLATTAYVAYRLPSGVTVHSGYYSAATQYVDHDGVLADGEPISIGWFRVGEGLEINASGDLAGRDAYDDEAGGFVYATNTGDLYRKNSATTADWGPAIPLKGVAGDKGWAPRFAVVADGARSVMQLAGYVGGTGTAPTANIGQYVSTGGYTAVIGSATDIRGATGATGAAGTNGTNGTNGTDGTDGTDPGVLMIWDEGTTDANPGSGVMRANNALTTSAAFLYVNKANRAGSAISVFLATLADSSSNRKGVITLTRPSDKAQATFDVVTLTDATGYVKIGVVNGGGTTFTDNDLISFQFAPSGDKGTDGLGAGNFVTEFEPAIDPTGNLVAFSDGTGTAGGDTGIPATDVVRKSLNGTDFGDRNATRDNLTRNGADIASAATVNLEAATGAFVEVTGTTTTTAITLSDGHQRLVRAGGAWPLTHSTNLQIQGGASYTCTAGDLLLVQADGAVIRVTVFPVSGQPMLRVTNAKLAQVATATIKGRTTASTGDVEDLTATQATAMLNAMVGDSGAGGTKGLVSAPAAGDAAAGKVWGASGAWVAVSNAELELTVSLLALQVADNTNVALFLGSSGNRYYDSFDALTYVDLVNSTNLDTSTAGVLKPTTSATTVTINTQNASNNLNGFTMIDRTVALVPGVVVTKIGLYSTAAGTAKVKIVKRNSANSYDVVVDQSFAHPGGGWADATLTVPFTVPGTGTYYLGSYNNTFGAMPNVNNAARAYISADLTGTGVATTGEDASSNVRSMRYTHSLVADTMTVYLGPFTAAASVNAIKALIRVKEVDAAIAGTDYTVRGSANNKANWFNIPLTELFTSPSPVAAIRVVDGASTNTSSHSGTAVWIEIKTVAKMVEIHDVYSYWS